MIDPEGIRAQIDTETVRGLQLVNGGLAIALVSWLPRLMDTPGQPWPSRMAGIGALCGAGGLAFSIVHNRLRRKCSLQYDRFVVDRDPASTWAFVRQFQSVKGEPAVCTRSVLWMWASFIAFAAGVTAAGSGFIFAWTGTPETVEPSQVVVAPVDSTAEKAKALAEAARLAYEAEERCGKTARDWWRESRWQFGSMKTPFDQPRMSYTSHFNRQRNGCYAHVVSEGPMADAKQIVVRESLYDVNTNRLLGQFASIASHPPIVMQCIFEDKQCHGFIEWASPVSEYMER